MTENLIPENIASLIRAANEWEDGDVWALGGGRTAEYHSRRQVFTISEKGVVVGEVPFRAIVTIPTIRRVK
jgi:hypothetical protein